MTSTALGASVIHDSGRLHVRGAATYVDDILEPAGTLHVAPGYAQEACGKILKVDLSRVLEAPGVVAVLTAPDIPGDNNCSPSLHDDRILADKAIDFHGQVVFAVVATTRDQARRAARLAVIEVAPGTPVVDVEAGLARNMEVLAPYRFSKGDAASLIRQSSHRRRGVMRVGGQDHFYLEGQVALAVPGEDDAMLVHSSTQHPSEVQQLVGAMLSVSSAAVVCECRRMGGAFGGKESQAAQWACLAALAARVTGHPAKLRLDRDDDMIMTGKRHDFQVGYEFGFDAGGRLDAVEVEFNARCGCSADLSLGVNDRTMFHCDNAYFFPAANILSRRVRTNTVSNTAFRGFGGPQGMLFAEMMMDSIAIERGLDPLLVRKRNLYRRGRDVTPYGMKVTDNLAPRIVRELEKTSDYHNRRRLISRFNSASRVLRKGIALTPVKFGISFTLRHLNQAGALVHLYTDGSLQVNHGGTEMGQGLYTKVAQVVADVFGVDLERVRVTATKTDKVPNTAPTAASSGTDLNAMAAKRAAESIKKRLVDLASRLYQADKSDVSFAANQVHIGDRQIPLQVLTRSAFSERVSLSSTGYYATPKLSWDRDLASGRPYLYFAYGAACSEVTVDVTTGEMRVDRVDILHDVGRSMNPAIDIGQIEGAFVQGMGWLTTEELVFDATGKLQTHAPSTYKIPTCSDVPADFRVALWESKGNPEPTIYRSKAVGEPPLMLAISVFSAITHAVASLGNGKIPALDAPATPESIMRAVDGVLAETAS